MTDASGRCKYIPAKPRTRASVIDRVWHDRVVLPLDPLLRLQLRDLDGERQSVHAELFGTFEHSYSAARTPEAKKLRTSLKGHRTHESDHAEEVVGVKVCEEDVGQGKRDSIAHHLPLGALTAVEQQSFAFAYDRERGDTALDCGTRSGGAEEPYNEGH